LYEIAGCSQIVDEYVRRPDMRHRNPDIIDSVKLAAIPTQILIDPALPSNNHRPILNQIRVCSKDGHASNFLDPTRPKLRKDYQVT